MERDESPLLTSPKGEEALQLLLHSVEGFIVLIVWIGALDVGDGVVVTEAGEGVDMTVCVVACEVAVVEPKEAVGMEIVKQTFLYLLTVKLWIAVGRKETGAGGQQRTFAIAFDATAFEDKIEMGLVEAMQKPL